MVTRGISQTLLDGGHVGDTLQTMSTGHLPPREYHEHSFVRFFKKNKRLGLFRSGAFANGVCWFTLRPRS